MTSAIDTSFITTAPVDKAPFKLALDTAASEITALQSGKVAKSGDVMTGDLEISKVSPALIMSKPALAQEVAIVSREGASNRWRINIANSASSSFSIDRYNDGGVLVDSPISIARSTGAPTFANASLWRTGLGVPASPSLLGFVPISLGASSSFTLPAGGTWAAAWSVYVSGAFATAAAGIFAGGSLVTATGVNEATGGCAWRIA